MTAETEEIADLIGEALAELATPLAHGLKVHADAARGQQFVDMPQAEREPEIESDGVADDLGPDRLSKPPA